VEDGRQAQSKSMPVLTCTDRVPVCHSNKKYLGVSHSDSGQLLLPPPTSPMVSLLLDFAAEIASLVVAEYGCPDNSYYVSSVLGEAVEVHLERGFGLN